MVHQRKTTVLHLSTSEFCQNAAVLTRLRLLKWFAVCLKSLQTAIFFCLARKGCGGNIKLTEWLVCSTAFRMSQSNILCIQFHVFPSVNKNPIHTKLGDFMNLKILVLLANTCANLHLDVFNDCLGWAESSACMECAWLCGKKLNADSGPADSQQRSHQGEVGGFQFSWRAALVSKSKKLRQRFIRKKRRNAREFWSLYIVPLTLVLLLDITQVTFVRSSPSTA